MVSKNGLSWRMSSAPALLPEAPMDGILIVTGMMNWKWSDQTYTAYFVALVSHFILVATGNSRNIKLLIIFETVKFTENHKMETVTNRIKLNLK
jgi:hypothetical protein